MAWRRVTQATSYRLTLETSPDQRGRLFLLVVVICMAMCIVISAPVVGLFAGLPEWTRSLFAILVISVLTLFVMAAAFSLRQQASEPLEGETIVVDASLRVVVVTRTRWGQTVSRSEFPLDTLGEVELLKGQRWWWIVSWVNPDNTYFTINAGSRGEMRTLAERVGGLLGRPVREVA